MRINITNMTLEFDVEFGVQNSSQLPSELSPKILINDFKNSYSSSNIHVNLTGVEIGKNLLIMKIKNKGVPELLKWLDEEA